MGDNQNRPANQTKNWKNQVADICLIFVFIVAVRNCVAALNGFVLLD